MHSIAEALIVGYFLLAEFAPLGVLAVADGAHAHLQLGYVAEALLLVEREINGLLAPPELANSALSFLPVWRFGEGLEGDLGIRAVFHGGGGAVVLGHPWDVCDPHTLHACPPRRL